MSLTNEERVNFIKRVADAVRALAPQYKIHVYSAIIAQAILESGWGESKLATEHFNFFGLKAGTQWTGKSVDLQTQEVYDGRTVTIVDAFRAYDDFDEGMKGYFGFIQKPWYANLKDARTPEDYCRNLVTDGYATDPAYAEALLNLIEEYDLDVYDPGAHVSTTSDGLKTIVRPRQTADALVSAMRSFLGFSEADGSYRQVIDLYNSQRVLPRGYKVSYDDPWCAATVSAAAIKAGLTGIVPTECSCEELVKKAQAMGIWIEDGSGVPEPGDLVLYNWDESKQPNGGFSDHIGVVEVVSGSAYTVIEGNYQDRVGMRTVPVGWGYVRGFVRPEYAKVEPVEPATDPAPGSEPAPSGPSKEPKWVGYVSADALNVRCWAGMEYPNILSYPVLCAGNLVDVCDTVRAADGSEWFYVRIAGRIYGFVAAEYVGRV